MTGTQLTATALTTAALMGFGTSDLTLAQAHQVVLSKLNPRKNVTREQEAELAQSIYEKTVFDDQGNVVKTGILQPLLGRMNDGVIEIAAGECRYRAVLALIEGLEVDVADGVDSNGRPKTKKRFLKVGADYPIPFTLRELTDTELVDAATTENQLRTNMTTLETADALMRLKGEGYSDSTLAFKFVLAPARVQALLTLASGLGKAGRKALLAGEINEEQARIVASTTGKLKEQLLDMARHSTSAAQMRRTVNSNGFLVSNARFDVEASGLTIDEGLLGDVTPRFMDSKKALEHQLAWAEGEQKAREAQGQKVAVVLQEKEYASQVEGWTSDYRYEARELHHTLLIVSSLTGAVSERQNMVREADLNALREAKKAAAKADGTGSQAVTGSGIRDAGRRMAHEARAMSLSAVLATNHKEALIATISTLAKPTYSPLHLNIPMHKPVPVTPEVQALALALSTRFPDVFTTQDDSLRVNHKALRPALRADDVTLEELLMVQAWFAQQLAGEWTTDKHDQPKGMSDYANEIGADLDLTMRFRLSADYLNAYTSTELEHLVATMPESHRPVFKTGESKKNMVTLIMEKADALKAQGWLPALVKF